MNDDMPTSALEVRRGNERIAAVISLTGKDQAVTGAREELLYCPRDSGTSLIHERLSRYSAGKRGVFCVAHLHRGNNRRGHPASELASFFSVLVPFLSA